MGFELWKKHNASVFGGGGPRSVVALGGRDGARPFQKAISRKRLAHNEETSNLFPKVVIVPLKRIYYKSKSSIG